MESAAAVPRGFGADPERRDRVHNTVGGHPARQGADFAVFEGSLKPEGDLAHLFAVGGHGAAVMANLGGMDDPEVDLGLILAVSRQAHLGRRSIGRKARFDERGGKVGVNWTGERRLTMKKIAAIAWVIITGIVLTSNALADSAAKEMCVAKVKEAVQLINGKGLDAAVAVINRKDGGFAWKDSYVFVVDFQGKTVANALFPNHVGMNQMGLASKDGRMIIQEFIEIAKTKGEGWSEYLWPKPEEMQKPKDQRISSKKASYVLRVPGQDMFVVAGVHE